jgi:hypothetical protein
VAFYPHKIRGSKRLPQNTSQYICGGLSAPQMTHFKKKIKKYGICAGGKPPQNEFFFEKNCIETLKHNNYNKTLVRNLYREVRYDDCREKKKLRCESCMKNERRLFSKNFSKKFLEGSMMIV